jgi:TrmH family RNA methyltransferase
VIRDIAGRQNHAIRLARKLQAKKHRRERGLLVGEGMDLLEAAWEAKAQIREVLVRRDLVGGLPRGLVDRAQSAAGEASDVNVGICDAETLAYASSLGGSADVIFVCVEPVAGLSDIDLGAGFSFFLDAVGDPGNVGTIVRSTVAFGGRGVICSSGTADPFGPKAMRAGMGAQFQIPVVAEVTPEDLRARLSVLAAKGAGIPDIWVADPHEGEDVRKVGSEAGIIVILGAERRGPSGGWKGAGAVRIPQVRLDSLNVAMAGTVLAYELARRGSAEVANSGSVS